MTSIFYNLVSNAIKYRDPERSPKIDIACTTFEKFLLLEVKDNGLGIKEEHLPKLFTMFKRFHDHVEGTGIGLYIIKRIIENRGGKVQVESKLGIGTTFKVFLRSSEA